MSIKSDDLISLHAEIPGDLRFIESGAALRSAVKIENEKLSSGVADGNFQVSSPAIVVSMVFVFVGPQPDPIPMVYIVTPTKTGRAFRGESL